VFISYRVESDDFHAEVLYEECKKRGLNVWLDSKCLQAGQNWQAEFARALIGSSVVICILSRGAVNHRTKDALNWGKLRKESPCDNLLLEMRLALEAKKRGMIEAILPVMVGDMDTNAVYSNFIRSGCSPPAVADVVVESVESALGESLEREGLGLSFEESMTAKAVYDAVLSNQAKFVEGDLRVCTTAVVHALTDMKASQVRQISQRYKAKMDDTTPFPTGQSRSGLHTKMMQIMVDENKVLKEENRMLKQKLTLRPK